MFSSQARSGTHGCVRRASLALHPGSLLSLTRWWTGWGVQQRMARLRSESTLKVVVGPVRSAEWCGPPTEAVPQPVGPDEARASLPSVRETSRSSSRSGACGIEAGERGDTGSSPLRLMGNRLSGHHVLGSKGQLVRDQGRRCRHRRGWPWCRPVNLSRATTPMLRWRGCGERKDGAGVIAMRAYGVGVTWSRAARSPGHWPGLRQGTCRGYDGSYCTAMASPAGRVTPRGAR